VFPYGSFLIVVLFRLGCVCEVDDSTPIGNPSSVIFKSTAPIDSH